MLGFEALIVANTILLAIAALRLRPTLFIILGNQIAVLLALLHIQEYGQPETEVANPAFVFSQSNLGTAASLFLISTALLMMGTLLPSRRPVDKLYLPALPRWLIVSLAVYVAWAAVAAGSIFSNAYTDASRLGLGSSITTSAVTELVISVGLYELYRRVRLRLLRSWAALALLFLMLTVVYLSKGLTGLAAGFLTCGALLLLRAAPARPGSWLATGGVIALSLILVVAVRGVRDTFYLDPESAVDSFTSAFLSPGDTEKSSEGIEMDANGTQYAAHVLECITLYDSGRSRELRSLSDPIINTLEPSFLVGPLGLQRPLVAATELQDYFISGGGSYTLGEFYWNGGYLCVLLMYALIVAFAYVCDTRYQSSLYWLLILCQFAPGVLQGIGYGFSQVFRVAMNGLLVVIVYRIGRRRRAASSERPTVQHAIPAVR